MWSELLNVIVGMSIGVTAEGWLQVFAGCIIWGFISLYLVRSIAGKAEYKPGTHLFFGSAALTRFIVWWPTAVIVSLISAGVVQLIRS
jgi:hypothetical protein